MEQLENLLEGKGYNNKSGRTGESEKPNSTTKVNKTKSNFRSGKLIYSQIKSIVTSLYFVIRWLVIATFIFIDYNPLMGNSGGSSRYRPDRRSAAGGGG